MYRVVETAHRFQGALADVDAVPALHLEHDLERLHRVETEIAEQIGLAGDAGRVVDLADLEKTGLIGFGSRASMQRLLKVPPAAFDQLVAGLRADLVNDFARVRSYKAMEDDIGEDFTRAENYLSLVGLVIVILGGIGVSSVTRVFVQQKMKSIAVLKCLGGRSSQLLAIYVAQVQWPTVLRRDIAGFDLNLVVPEAIDFYALRRDPAAAPAEDASA